MTDTVRVDDLVAGYGKATILQGAFLRVASDEIVAVIGPNGAGKSTLLKAIAGLVSIQSGTIQLNGTDVTGKDPGQMGELGVAYVPQVQNIFPSLTIRENLSLMLPRKTPRREVNEKIEQTFEFFPSLMGRGKVRASLLSGGERQMLAFARALMVKPKIILLDEPSAALSPLLVDEVFEKVETIRSSGTAILLVEQNARQALNIADRAYVLESGRNVFDGPAKEMLSDPQIGHIYLGGTYEGTET
jgi:ABC-type branched-subunit amino acid transport system ATPase component